MSNLEVALFMHYTIVGILVIITVYTTIKRWNDND